MEDGLNPLRVKLDHISLMKDNEYIDIVCLPNPTKYTEKLDKTLFLGTYFSIPNNVDEYLTIVYGNWRVPSKLSSNITPGIYPWTNPKKVLRERLRQCYEGIGGLDKSLEILKKKQGENIEIQKEQLLVSRKKLIELIPEFQKKILNEN
jgi:hypothetical protein